jgi:hypothetical protein
MEARLKLAARSQVDFQAWLWELFANAGSSLAESGSIEPRSHLVNVIRDRMGVQDMMFICVEDCENARVNVEQ